jgi:large subunit ribosomal protein L25
MEAIELKAELREARKSQVKNLRRQGLVPAVVYGKGSDATSIQIEAKPLRKVLREAGTHQLISLLIDNEPPKLALARDIQQNALNRDYLHVDFYAVTMGEKVTANVPIILKGVSPAVRDKGGLLMQGLDQVDIECLPSKLIASIEVNVEGLLDFNDSISVSDLDLSEDITILSDPDSLVARIEAPRTEEQLEEMDEEVGVVASVAPEVLTAAKEDEE